MFCATIIVETTPITVERKLAWLSGTRWSWCWLVTLSRTGDWTWKWEWYMAGFISISRAASTHSWRRCVTLSVWRSAKHLPSLRPSLHALKFMPTKLSLSVQSWMLHKISSLSIRLSWDSLVLFCGLHFEQDQMFLGQCRELCGWQHQMKHKLAFAFERRPISEMDYTRIVLQTCANQSWSCYTDASWSPEGDYSHQAAVIYYGNNLVAGQSQRQGLVALSSAEAELIASVWGIRLTLSIQVTWVSWSLRGPCMSLTQRQRCCCATFATACCQ